jgi:hypothetical protein
MDVVLGNLRWECALVYVDDINVYSKHFDQHLIDLQRIFSILIQAGLKLKPSKCSFGMPELVYLGHVFSKWGIRPDPEKLRAVEEFPVPVNTECLQSFIGLINHYRRFVEAFAMIALPQYQLLKKGVSWRWNVAEQGAFTRLKEALCTIPILIYPRFELSFLIQTDASRDAVGAILSQRIEGQERVVAYASRTMSKSEKNYAITDKEGLALIFAIKHFRPYLHGSHFTIETDHAPLKVLQTSRELTGRLARWALILQSYDCTILYKPGHLHGNTDALTRSKPMELEPYTKIEDIQIQETGPMDNQAMMVTYKPPSCPKMRTQ